MRKILMLGTAAIFVACASLDANAANPNVPSWSPYAIMGDDAAPWIVRQRPMTERRAADTNFGPAAAVNGNIDYKSVGLSGSHWDCNDGCAVSNGD